MGREDELHTENTLIRTHLGSCNFKPRLRFYSALDSNVQDAVKS